MFLFDKIATSISRKRLASVIGSSTQERVFVASDFAANTNRAGKPRRTFSSQSLKRMMASALPILAMTAMPQAAHADTQTITTGGTAGTFTVPAGVSQIRISARGGAGGVDTNSSATGGAGATVVGVFNVTAGDVVRYVVGEQGASNANDAGGGGSTGVFINNTLVIVAGGGGGFDNTATFTGLAAPGDTVIPNIAGALAAEDAMDSFAVVLPTGPTCVAVPGGTAGGGGGGANFTSTGTDCSPSGGGGSGGGGVFSAGLNSVAAVAQVVIGGGGAADLVPADGLTVAAGGAATNVTDQGVAGGRGFTGGGGSDGREAGGGGGYSGGAGANNGRGPTGGGSFLTGEVGGTGSKTDGGMGDTGDGQLVLEYSQITLNKTLTGIADGDPREDDYVLRVSSTEGDVTTATAFADDDVIGPVLAAGGGTNTYTVSEDATSVATDPQSITCSGGSASGATIPFTVADLGTDYTCVIENEAPDPVLAMTKVADDDALVTVGQVVTYTYTVTNNGNVAVAGVTVNDVHNGSGPAPTPAGETLTDNGTIGDSTDATPNDGVWDNLAPGDVVTFTGTYTVTQTDIDNLQ